jgi:hypothetical protein
MLACWNFPLATMHVVARVLAGYEAPLEAPDLDIKVLEHVESILEQLLRSLQDKVRFST